MRIWKTRLQEQLDVIATIPGEVKRIADEFDYSIPI
jgi:hypothetical protein